MRYTGLSVGFLLMACAGLAQDMAPDTTLYLKDVSIYSDRAGKFAKGQRMNTADSLSRLEDPLSSLSELVSSHTSAYIRNYGQGTLTTLSFRGTSSNHTGLLWNGIRISPPNIGYLDLSLIRQGYFSDISFLYGGASPMFGSGNIGGSIHLENRPVFSKNGFDASFGLSAGSFGNFGVESSAIVTRENFYSHTAFSLSSGRNDFTYTNFNNEKEHLSHASMLKPGFIQDIAFRLKGDQYLMASAWFNYAEREIPPTMVQEVSEAVQTDRSWRTMLMWKDFNARNNLEAKMAYFNEYTRYDDPPSSVFSTIESQVVTGSFEATFELGNYSAFFAGSQYTYEHADLVYYDEPKSQNTLALLASFRRSFQSAGWQASLNARQEFLTGFKVPFLFSVGGEGKIWRFISGRFSVSRNFRAPTFNERFWQPGGNPDLEPEESWNEEIAIMTDHQFNDAKLSLQFTIFNSNVSNWILWLPDGSYWSVENAQDVWSRGAEISGDQSFVTGAFNVYFSESYTYSKSTNEKKLFDLDASYKKQLIYTPFHRFLIKSGVIYKGFNMALKGNFTGEVYTTRDNSESVQPYFLMDMIFSKAFRVKSKYPLTIQLNINNILNKEYQVIPYRPMAGINGMITVRVDVDRH